MKKILISLVVFSLLAPASSVVFAQNGIRERIQENAEKLREEVKIRTEQQREELKIRFEEKRKEAEERLKSQREEFKTRIEEKKTEVKQKLEERKKELKTQLQKVKDERKKQAVERINERISKLNEKITKHFVNFLDKLAKILDNIASRADKAESNGLDVSPVRAAIISAENTITSARAAVETQAGKVYSFTVTSEENLKVDVGAARQALHDDLTALRNMIFAARDAVHNAAVTLAQIPRVDEEEKSTSTATSTE